MILPSEETKMFELIGCKKFKKLQDWQFSESINFPQNVTTDLGTSKREMCVIRTQSAVLETFQQDSSLSSQRAPVHILAF